MASDLSRDFLGQRFQNPVLLASGTAAFGRELAGIVDLDRLGGLVTKAVSSVQRQTSERRTRKSGVASTVP